MLSLSHSLILGSKSPRRKELLTKASLSFTQRVVDTDESYPDTLSIPQIAEYIAHQKALAQKELLSDNELLLTADTIVVHQGQVYGKPKDAVDAYRILRLLSDNSHLVYTGVVLMSMDKEIQFTVESKVNFEVLDEDEIQWYVSQYKPYDKAGAYGIQDWIGQVKIKRIEGSYTNILGLPMGETYQALKEF